MSDSQPVLQPEHLADLRASGLNDETIRRCGFQSFLRWQLIRTVLLWDVPKSLAPAWGVRYRDLHGRLECPIYWRVKPDRPRRDGKRTIKYEAPKGRPARAFYPSGKTLKAIHKNAPLLITEGEKKAAKADQEGFPCIGLAGVWAWQKKRPRDTNKKPYGERELIDDLAAMTWQGRQVYLVFDSDAVEKQEVLWAEAHLLEKLSHLGADVHIVRLPPGHAAGRCTPVKVGLDDFLVQHGAAALQELLERAEKLYEDDCNEGGTVKSLDQWRQEMAMARIQSVQHPGIYFDGSPPGAGKSTADVVAMHAALRSITLLPTHENCGELTEELAGHRIPAVAFPRLDSETCSNHDEAEIALQSGLSPSMSVCPDCPCRKGCTYQQQYEWAKRLNHSVATHRRGARSLASLAEGRSLILVHEDAHDMLRPIEEFAGGMSAILPVVDDASGLAQKRRNPTAHQFFWQMRKVAMWLKSEMEQANETKLLELPDPVGAPYRYEVMLYDAIKRLEATVSPGVMRTCIALATGSLHQLAICVDHRRDKDGEERIHKSFVAVWQTRLPEGVTIWFEDATGDPKLLELLIGQPIQNMTPTGRLERQVQVEQVPVDVTKGTSPEKVCALLRGLLASRPEAKRVGVLCWRTHKPTIDGTSGNGPVLDAEFRRRIAKIAYFGQGPDRGSNEWLNCDLVVVLGTPRVAPAAVKTWLLRTGHGEAALRDGLWGPRIWKGRTVSGSTRLVLGRGYKDPTWALGYRELVVSPLVQAAGRGRAHQEDGVPVVLFSNEPIRLPLADEDPGTASESLMRVVKGLEELARPRDPGNLSLESPKYNTLANASDNPGVSTEEIAAKVGLKPAMTRRHLAEAEEKGLVKRVGKRGGWVPAPAAA